jgi:hypothetical protein
MGLFAVRSGILSEEGGEIQALLPMKRHEDCIIRRAVFFESEEAV